MLENVILVNISDWSNPNVMSTTSKTTFPIDANAGDVYIFFVTTEKATFESITPFLPVNYNWIEATSFRPLINGDNSLPDVIIVQADCDCHTICNWLKTNPIPVIMLLEENDADIRLETRRNGVSAFLPSDVGQEELLLTINNLVRLQRPLDSKGRPDFITELKTYIDCVLQRHHHIKVRDLCLYVNLSQPSLYRRVNQVTGMSPKSLIMNRQCERAVHLITHSACNISEIAYQCGFSSPGYFSRVFKQNKGMTPNAYRKMLVTE